MNSKMNTGKLNNRRGSYIVEAVITLPIFMVSVIVLISIILMYACVENANYTLANEMRREAAQAGIVSDRLIFGYGTAGKISRENHLVDKLTIKDYAYKEERSDIDQVIAVRYDMELKAENPLVLASQAHYEPALMSRAYVGRTRADDPMSESDMGSDVSDPVFIFPKRGEKYHREGCTFIQAGSTSAVLDTGLKNKYTACPACGSKAASVGSRIYIFPEYGEVYHLPGCRVLERNYIEVDREVAENRGYTPCAKCGG